VKVLNEQNYRSFLLTRHDFLDKCRLYAGILITVKQYQLRYSIDINPRDSLPINKPKLLTF